MSDRLDDSYNGSVVNPAQRELNFDSSDTALLEESSPRPADGAGKAISKRPFLKKGSRMPVSKIPPDPFTPVVAAIKNPPPARVSGNGLDPHDLERVRTGEVIDSGARRPKSSPVIRSEPFKESNEKEDLESFLRDMSNSVITVAEHLRNSPRRPSSRQALENDEFTRIHPPRPSSRQAVDTSSYPPVALHPRPPSRISETGSMGRRRAAVASESSRRPITDGFDDSGIELEMKKKLQELDEQISKFKKENEYCKKLRLEREAALADAQRTRERALAELGAAEKDIQDQRSQLMLERKRMHQDKDRGYTLASQVRELSEENRQLREKLEATEATMVEKVSRLKAEIVRLTGTVSDLMKCPPPQQVSAVQKQSAPSVSNELIESAVIQSYTHQDGRVDRTYADGRREAVFPSGLRKTVWPDGAAIVRFPNGDVKQTSVSGVTIYQYASTGCVQTTQPDGVEILQFPSGQIETHFVDGLKEIRFPNGSVKRIDPPNVN